MIVYDTLSPLIFQLNPVELEMGVEAILEGWAGVLESYAQDNAPWADRTGAARAGLRAEVLRSGDAVELVLAHTVEYGIWLETIQGGAYAIIMPTIEQYAHEVLASVAATEASVI